MHRDRLKKVLVNNILLQETWSLPAHVAAEMALVPPYYKFDILAFTQRPFQCKESVLRQYDAEMKVAEITLPQGVHIMSAELESSSDGYICIDSAEPYIQLFFALNSDRNYYVDGRSLGKIAPGQVEAYLFCAKEIVALWHWRPSDRFVEINISLATFRTWLPKNDPIQRVLESMLSHNQSASILGQPLSISLHLQQILNDLLLREMDDEWHELLCSGKIMELIAYIFHLHRIQAIGGDHSKELTEEMRKLMAQAKQILEERMSAPPSLAELSAELGTNENYLKKYFKMCYQTTIYGYVTQIRMDKARKLLLEGERPIKEISRFLGYHNPAHFSASFKKHFGVVPKSVYQT